MTSPINYTGRRKGMLVAKYRVGSNKHGSSIWHFDCDCGGFKEVSPNNIFGDFRNTFCCGCCTLGKKGMKYFKQEDVRLPEVKSLKPGILAIRVYNAGKLVKEIVNK